MTLPSINKRAMKGTPTFYAILAAVNLLFNTPVNLLVGHWYIAVVCAPIGIMCAVITVIAYRNNLRDIESEDARDR